jgi:hypothetical protein
MKGHPETAAEAANAQQRSGGFLVNGYSEWLKRYTFAPVTHPVHGNPSGFTQADARQSADIAAIP